MKKRVHNNSGFTLVELMVVIAVLAILGGLVFSDRFFNTFRKANVSSTAIALHAALNYARNESLNRGTPVTFCRPNAGATNCDDGAEWGKGWMVISSDNDGNNVVRVFPSTFASGSNYTLGKTGANSIVFRNGSASENATFVLCEGPLMNANARQVVVTMAGRIRTVTGDDPTAPVANCI